MPLIEVHLARGRTEQQKRALMEAITEAVQRSIDAPLPSIRVWIHEFAPDEFMAAGEVLADRHPDGEERR
jgi:4-oxalocrotonate tautomerase